VLIAPAIVTLTIGNGESPVLRYGIAGAALVVVIGAVAVSKSRDLAIGGETPEELGEEEAAVAQARTHEPSPGNVTEGDETHGSELEEEPHLRR
jgi:K(+)-stimulated pyrophosphate-energized sodium pump